MYTYPLALKVSVELGLDDRYLGYHFRFNQVLNNIANILSRYSIDMQQHIWHEY